MMKGTLWRAFLGSFVLFLLSWGACDYAAWEEHRLEEEATAAGFHVCGGGVFPSDWEVLGAILFIASVSVAGGGAMRWWRVEFDGEADVRALVLGIRGEAAGGAGAIEETREAALAEAPAREEVPAHGEAPAHEGVPAPTTARLFPEDAHPFEHFDEQGRSPLERVLAEY